MSRYILSAVQKVNGFATKQCVRFKAYYGPEPRPELIPSLSQKLAALNPPDPLAFKVDIGLPKPKSDRRSAVSEKPKILAQIRNDENLEKLARDRKLIVPLEAVEEEWKKEQAVKDIKIIAEYYNIYDDLFGDAFFFPRIMMNIEYILNEESVMPVCRGNLLKPREVTKAPLVTYEAQEGSLWTLVLTNLDGHLSEENAEYVHWFIGNIPGNDLSKGDLVYDYLPPFPPAGTGYHRLVFVLYKQEKILDFSSLKKQSPCTSLSLRTFHTLDFYRSRQDDLTPAGLSFYQCDYDTSVQETFQKVLKMKEPRFEYDFPEYYIRPQKWFPKGKSFDQYLDKYRDPKEINKDYIVKRLKSYDPFEKSPRRLQYPNAQQMRGRFKYTWLYRKFQRDNLRWGDINEAE